MVDIDGTPVNEIEETVKDEETIELHVENIKKAVAQLPNGYRTVLSLVLFEQYSYTDVSTALNISETTVRTQYHRARQKMLQLLKKELHNDRQTETIH